MWCKGYQVRSQFGDRVLMHVFSSLSKEGGSDVVLISHAVSSTRATNHSQHQNEGSPTAAAPTHLSTLLIVIFYTD